MAVVTSVKWNKIKYIMSEIETFGFFDIWHKYRS